MKKYVYNPGNAVILLSLFSIFAVVFGGNTAASDIFLKPPGLRLISEPQTVIPGIHRYLNQEPRLPQYRGADGAPLDGWSREYVKTRRFSSDQSAWVYFRTADLKRASVIPSSGALKMMRIWPPGTTLVLEGYKGDAANNNTRNLLEIAVMKKAERPTLSEQRPYYPVNWSYARFGADGKSSLSTEKLNECHQCHSIAFRLTGDLVFTNFP